jgi:large subunit ribosomal protein L7/L12
VGTSGNAHPTELLEIDNGALKGKTLMDADFEDELSTLLAQRRKIEAIKLYRDRTGASLKVAKDAVEALERGEALRIGPRPLGNVEEEIVSLVEQGRKIEAIKLYRERFGAGLKEAKEAVEALARERGIPLKSGCLGMILLLFLILLGHASL